MTQFVLCKLTLFFSTFLNTFKANFDDRLIFSIVSSLYQVAFIHSITVGYLK